MEVKESVESWTFCGASDLAVPDDVPMLIAEYARPFGADAVALSPPGPDRTAQAVRRPPAR